MKKIIYNIEPKDYSNKAIEKWKDLGYSYVEGSWDNYYFFKDFLLVEILIVRLGGMVNKKIIDFFPNLKVILSATTGHNHIDKPTIDKKNIKIITLRGENKFLEKIPSTAELTWGLILNIFRNIHSSNNDVISGNWNRENFKGFQLSNKKIGIVGLGRIGKKVAKYALAFDMKVSYYDPNVFDETYSKVDCIEDLVNTVDILTIHIHADPSNYKFFDKKLISQIKKGTAIVNTSRGEIWDELQIVEALKKNQLAAVATDVIDNETLGYEKSPIWEARFEDNMLITPHIGGASFDAMWDCEEHIQKLFIKKFLNEKN